MERVLERLTSQTKVDTDSPNFDEGCSDGYFLNTHRDGCKSAFSRGERYLMIIVKQLAEPLIGGMAMDLSLTTLVNLLWTGGMDSWTMC